MKNSTITKAAERSSFEVYVPKFDLSVASRVSLAQQLVDFLLPVNASQLAKSAYVILDGVGNKAVADQAAFVSSCKLEYVTGVNQTDYQSCVRALVSSMILTVSRSTKELTASDKVEEAKTLLCDITDADW